MEDPADHLPEDELVFHKRREAEECELAAVATSVEDRLLHFERAAQHARFLDARAANPKLVIDLGAAN